MHVQPSSRVKVVTIGGGTGQSILLQGLKHHADRLDITAIVTTFDDGGSSGVLRREFGVPALGDIRRCLAALMPSSPESSKLVAILEHRFTSNGSLNNHSLGNLILLAEWQRHGNLTEAINSIVPYPRLLGKVIPISEQPATICAELANRTIIEGETAVGERNQELFASSNLYLEPQVDANPDAIEAVKNADFIILGPGDLFTSVIPNLLPNGMTEAFSQSSAHIIQICNIARKLGETRNYVASDFPTTIRHYLNPNNHDAATHRRVNAIIINKPSDADRNPQQPIEPDPKLNHKVEITIISELSDPTNPNQHHPEKLAAILIEHINTQH